MALLDGDTDIDVYPETESADAYGNERMMPSAAPTRIRGLVQPSSSEELQLLGQVTGNVVRIMCRAFPAGPWGKVTILAGPYAGDWDVTRPPSRRRYTRATSHDTVWVKQR